jgi:glycine/D-amino acid oxidase-like deaminating enzyme/nitrite reductase/ring-hydroxylating ferredoxin subunit
MAGETAHDRVPESGIEVECAVVGGGIVGLTAARSLVESGQTVAVVERDRIAGGVTTHSTAKLTAQHGLIYAHLRKHFGDREARQYAHANQAAIDHVEARVDGGIDASFRRTPAYTYRTGQGARTTLREEVAAAQGVGLPATFVEDVPFEPAAPAAVRLDDQAAFDPRAYLLGIAREIPGAGSRIYEQTTALDLSRDGRWDIRTDTGTVTAADVVVASHVPFDDRGAYFARLVPRRSYVLALRLAEEPPTGLYYRAEDPYFSVRPLAERAILVGGQHHRTGHGESTASHYAALEREARETFAVSEITHRWSTQDVTSIDRVPFVGQLAPQTPGVYVATGFGGWGLSNGVAAGRLLADLVLDRENPWADVYDPSRLQPRAAAGRALGHALHTGKHFLRSRLGIGTTRGQGSLQRGEARVVDDTATGPIALSRDADGTVRAHSAVCPHMGCRVTWNDAEESWDCPCHGSRFDVDGTVLDGPAVERLTPVTPGPEFLPREESPPESGDD